MSPSLPFLVLQPPGDRGTSAIAGAGTQAQGRGEEGPVGPGGWAGSFFGAPALLDDQGEVWAAFECKHGTADRGHRSGQPRLLTAGVCPAPAGFLMSSDQETPPGWEAYPEARADVNPALGLQSPLTLSWPTFPHSCPAALRGT